MGKRTPSDVLKEQVRTLKQDLQHKEEELKRAKAELVKQEQREAERLAAKDVALQGQLCEERAKYIELGRKAAMDSLKEFKALMSGGTDSSNGTPPSAALYSSARSA